MSNKKQELLSIREHLSSPLVFGGGRVPHFVQFIVLFYYVSLRFEFRVVMSLTIPHEITFIMKRLESQII